MCWICPQLCPNFGQCPLPRYGLEDGPRNRKTSRQAIHDRRSRSERSKPLALIHVREKFIRYVFMKKQGGPWRDHFETYFVLESWFTFPSGPNLPGYWQPPCHYISRQSSNGMMHCYPRSLDFLRWPRPAALRLAEAFMCFEALALMQCCSDSMFLAPSLEITRFGLFRCDRM